MNHWYQPNKFFLKYLLLPLSYVFRFIVFLRRYLYKFGIFKIKHFPVPVIIIGNLTVGGTGKTPLLIALAAYFKSLNYQVGIVSRGYGGKQKSPHLVSVTDDPLQVGDEAVLLARNTQCPVVVARDRAAAVSCLLEKTACNLVLSDDGLQHYGLHRDIEIVAVDGERQFGNGACLPAGPLREPVSRLKTVDFMLVNGIADNDYSFTVQPREFRRVNDDTPVSMIDCQNKKIAVMAGIGNPQRFFNTLRSMGFYFKEYTFPDHHAFTAEEIAFPQAEFIIMTEKDAVKCQKFADSRHVYLAVIAKCQDPFLEKLHIKLS